MTDTYRHLDPSQSGILLDALRDVVGPQLYRANAFRVSGLSVATEDAEMYSQLKKLEMLAKLGSTAQQGQTEALPLQPPPDSDAIRNASRRLHDMQSRLVDEFFWFWPLGRISGPDGDLGFELLRRGDVSGAHKYWSGVGRDKHDWFKANHNLAVLYHALALDIEHTAESQTDQLGSGIQTLREKYWQMALRYWLSTVADEALWVHMASRAEKLDDPRLTPDFIGRLRQSLPAAISSISVDLTVHAAKRGDAGQAKRHMAYIRESGFDPELIDRRLDGEARGFVDQIQRICKPIAARCKSMPAEAYRLAEGVLKDSKTPLIGMRAMLAEEHTLWQEASNLVGTTVTKCLVVYRDTVAKQSKHAPAMADQLAKGILEESKGLLAEIRATFDEKHSLRQRVSDLVARTVRDCMIEYGKETEDWHGCIPMLEEAAGLAFDKGLRALLQKDIAQVRENDTKKPGVERPPEAVTADRVYEVTISSCVDGIELPEGGGVLHRVLREKTGLRASVPGMCTCCLEPPSGEQGVSHEWEESRGLTKYKRSLSFSFPICETCRSHQSEYAWKRFVLVVLAAGISIGVAFLVAGQIQRPDWSHFVAGGGILTILLAVMLSAMIRLQALSEQHACRSQAVEMPEASDSHVVFRFHNPLYAEAFAHSNGVAVRERQRRKPTRGSYILTGRGAFGSVIVAIILAGVGHSIIYGQETWWFSSYNVARSSPSTPSRTHTSPQPSTPSRTYSGLSARIDSGKARAQILEAEIKRMDSELESLSVTLARHKRGIEAYERLVRSGQRPDESAYRSTLESHNRIVGQYNSLLSDRKAKYSEYQREIESVNDMVARYNRGER